MHRAKYTNTTLLDHIVCNIPDQQGVKQSIIRVLSNMYFIRLVHKENCIHSGTHMDVVGKLLRMLCNKKYKHDVMMRPKLIGSYTRKTTGPNTLPRVIAMEPAEQS